jgi:hypothetical protein
MPTYAQNKASIYRWVEKNRERSNELHRNTYYKNHEINKERRRIKSKWYYEIKKEFRLFLRILLN